MHLFISAGDPSGDNATAHLIESLHSMESNLTLSGLGGPRLKALGQTQIVDGDRLAVLGFWEVAKNFLFFQQLMKQTIEHIEKTKPSAILLVDYPGFNLRLAERVKHLGIPIIYYISPQVWAWGHKRIKQIERLVDLMLLILPFEKDYYADKNVRSVFVGHYLLEEIPSEYISSDPPEAERQSVCLMPGSRTQEVERMLPSMLEAGRRMHNEFGVQVRVGAVSGLYDYESAVKQYDGSAIELVYDRPRECMYESSIVLTASGTTTLEAGIIGRPMVIVYRTGQITYQIAKRLVKLDSIGLVNLVAGKKIMPELIQGEANPEQMFTALARYWQDEQYYRLSCTELERIPEILGGVGASDRTAKEILEYIQG